MKFVKGKPFIAIIFFLFGMLFTQLLFGGWGDGVIDYFFNKPEVIIKQTIILSEESQEPITMAAGMNPFGFGFITGIEVENTNLTHCLISYFLYASEMDDPENVELWMDVDGLNESFAPENCDKEKDCIQFSYSLRSRNNEDVDQLYVELCAKEGYSFLSEENQYLDCITLDESFLPTQKDIHNGVYMKIHNIPPNETLVDYVKKNVESLYPEVFIRDKKRKSLSYKEIKILVHDILNCKVLVS